MTPVIGFFWALIIAVFSTSVFLFVTHFQKIHVTFITNFIRLLIYTLCVRCGFIKPVSITDYTPNTTAYWINKMQEPERSLAFKYANRDLLYEYCGSIQDALHSIYWKKTKQGYDFWKSIWDKYERSNINAKA